MKVPVIYLFFSSTKFFQIEILFISSFLNIRIHVTIKLRDYEKCRTFHFLIQVGYMYQRYIKWKPRYRNYKDILLKLDDRCRINDFKAHT